MKTSMYEQMSDEVSKCLMLNGICLVHSEHKIKTNHKVGLMVKINKMTLTFHFHDFDISVFLI